MVISVAYEGLMTICIPQSLPTKHDWPPPGKLQLPRPLRSKWRRWCQGLDGLRILSPQAERHQHVA
ncbi:hypothetical protein FPSE_04135 [Fusarium pseudograminearum CS3096]|uniref:Uncharacterized protein n=1 Tax=Fusarium pseudograminearum (strain CS3096) TaxID=1028729 RepID=K3VLX2_FUSPC|nr:hypothetical protein FPSE_04135 [Fusarium pseudograminearum CS3096]EKJ75634.1 hypothetical protein FPSE_04135 [Fusarium pseudograminearum CS3096]